MPASMIASAQGGVRPWCGQGSSVTYIVAPRARSPACRRATTSACGPGGGWVAPSPTISPPATMTAPTVGLGEVMPRAARASSRARCMKWPLPSAPLPPGSPGGAWLGGSGDRAGMAGILSHAGRVYWCRLSALEGGRPMASSETVAGIIDSIRPHREKFERFCRSLSEEELARPVPDSAWVVKEFVSHLGTLDPELARTFEAAASGRPEDAGRNADGTPFDLDGFNDAQVAERRGWPLERPP